MAKEKEPHTGERKKAISKGRKSSKKTTLPAIKASAGAAPTARKTRVKAAKTNAAKPTLSNLQEAIRLRAYEIYLQRGCQPGSPHEDWAVAEREVRNYLDQITNTQA